MRPLVTNEATNMAAMSALRSASEPKPLLLALADEVQERAPGFRVEIIGGRITATPPADFAHARALTKIMLRIGAAVDGGAAEVVQAVGVWLGGPEDYAIPDYSIVDADIEEHLVKYNCYEPVCFRAVLEVTSSNRSSDLVDKRAAYAEAGIPVYVIVDRKDQVVLVLTDPADEDYQSEMIYHRGESFTLPDSVGTRAVIDVDLALGL